MISANTSDNLLESLVGVFPQFRDEWESGEASQSLHHVIGRFAVFFGRHAQSLTDKQLTTLGQFINQAVMNDDMLGNALSTCFLEHLHQVDTRKVMCPYLSKDAKRKMHA
jgi:hypothetical protein